MIRFARAHSDRHGVKGFFVCVIVMIQTTVSVSLNSETTLLQVTPVVQAGAIAPGKRFIVVRTCGNSTVAAAQEHFASVQVVKRHKYDTGTHLY